MDKYQYQKYQSPGKDKIVEFNQQIRSVIKLSCFTETYIDLLI